MHSGNGGLNFPYQSGNETGNAKRFFSLYLNKNDFKALLMSFYLFPPTPVTGKISLVTRVVIRAWV